MDNPIDEYFEDLAEHLPDVFASLRAGASDADIAALELALDHRLPEDARALLRRFDGQPPDTIGAIYGMRLLSCAEIREAWEMWQRVRHSTQSLDELDEPVVSMQPGAIQPRYTTDGWIPLFRLGDSSFIGLDLNPGPNGIVGQLINFGRNHDAKYVAAPNVTAWFALLVEWLAHEAASADAAAASANLDALFVRGHLPLWRCHRLARGETAAYRRVHVPQSAVPLPQDVDAAAAAVLVAACDALAVRAPGDARYALLEFDRDDFAFRTRTGLGDHWRFMAPGDDIRATAFGFVVTAERHGLPMSFYATFRLLDDGWVANMRVVCE